MKINHAIIGCGHIAPSHVDACNYNQITIATCCDLDKNKAKKFAEKYNILSVSSTFEDVIADKTIDSVSICTDHKSHAPLAIAALSAGKNVIVEKPMALSLADARKMLDTAKSHNKTLTVISQHRFNPVIMEIKKAVVMGVFGDITMINATLNSQKDKEYYTNSYWKGKLDQEGGSSLINQAIHTLDLLLWIKGTTPKDVCAYQSNLKFKGIIETEDTLAAVMKFPDESLGILSTTNTSIDIWDSKIEFVGTKGTISFSADYPVKIHHLIHQDPSVAKSLSALLEKFSDKFETPPPVSYYGTKHREQMGDFFNVIAGKSKKLFMDPNDAYLTLSIVLKIYQSSRNH